MIGWLVVLQRVKIVTRYRCMFETEHCNFNSTYDSLKIDYKLQNTNYKIQNTNYKLKFEKLLKKG